MKALLAKGKRVDDMFSNQGALGSLAAKINLAFALGLPSPAVYRDLDQVRNHFAHFLSEASFAEPPVNDWVGRSTCLAMNKASNWSPGTRLLLNGIMILHCPKIPLRLCERMMKIPAPHRNSSAIDQLRTAVTDGQVVVFAGTGVSFATTGGARTTSWRGLIEHGIEWCCHNSPALKEEWESWMRAGLRGTLNQLLAVAEAVTSVLDAPRGDYAAWLRAAFCDLKVTDKATIEALVSLDLPIVTTNYDIV